MTPLNGRSIWQLFPELGTAFALKCGCRIGVKENAPQRKILGSVRTLRNTINFLVFVNFYR